MVELTVHSQRISPYAGAWEGQLASIQAPCRATRRRQTSAKLFP